MNFKKICSLVSLALLALGLTVILANAQTPLIDNPNQIKNGIIEKKIAPTLTAIAVSTAGLRTSLTLETTTRIAADVALAASTTTIAGNLTTEISNRTNADIALAASTTTIAGNLSTEITDRENGDIALAASTTTIAGDLANYLPLAGGTMNGNLIISTGSKLGINTANPIFALEVDTCSYFESIHTKHGEWGSMDPFNRPQLWYYEPDSILRMGSAISDGDTSDIDSHGIIIYNPTQDTASRVRSDRLGLTKTSDTSLYHFRVDKDNLFYKSDDLTTTLFGVTRVSSQTAVNGELCLNGNCQASWPVGDNLGNHIATTTLNINNQQIVNAKSILLSTGTNDISGYLPIAEPLISMSAFDYNESWRNPTINSYRVNGIETSSSAVNAWDAILKMASYGWTGETFAGAGGIQIIAADTWSPDPASPSGSYHPSKIIFEANPTLNPGMFYAPLIIGGDLIEIATATTITNGDLTLTSGGISASNGVSAAYLQQSSVTSCTLGLTTDASGMIDGCVASDKSLKTYVTKLGEAGAIIDKLKPVNYKWSAKSKRDQNKHAGFIAQEVQKVYPQGVSASGRNLLGVDANAINALLVKEIQSLRLRVAALEKK